MQNLKLIKNNASITLIASRAFLTILAAACATAAQDDRPVYTVKSPAAAKPASSISQQFEKEGVVIDFLMKSRKLDDGIDPGLVAGADAVVSFQVKDKQTGLPVTGLRPSAWISARANAHAPNESECKDKIRTFMAGMLSVRADIDLNSYSMLTLNHDNTVTFINPQISFSVTKLESIVALPGYGADWALSKNKDFLYLTLPHQSADDLLLRRRDDGPDGDISELQAETSRIAGDRPKPRRDRAGRVLASDQAQGGGHI